MTRRSTPNATGDPSQDRSLVVVVDLQDRRPVWSMPDWVPDRIRAAAGPEAEVRVIAVPSDGSGDGAARVHPSVLEAVSDADVYLGYGVAPELLESGKNLRWIHSGSAGVGGSLTPELVARDVDFTNSAGIHAQPIADTVLAMALHFTRGLDFATRNQARGAWETTPFYEADAPLRELSELRVGIVGYGGVGRAVAARFHAVGSAVSALRRRAGKEAREDPTQVLWGPAGLERIVASSDVLVLCAPGTPETDGMIDAQALAKLPDGALIVNVGRGSLLDEEALVAELEKGRLRGAALDVFVSEPLSANSPLWSRTDVLITPHVSGVTRRYWDRQADLIVENLARFRTGRELLNVVDKRAGY